MQISHFPCKRLSAALLIGIGSAHLTLPVTAKEGKSRTSRVQKRTNAPTTSPSSDEGALSNLWQVEQLRNFGTPSLVSVFQNSDILAKTPERTDHPATRLSLYHDGAVVSRIFTNQEIHKDGQFIIPSFSDSVEPTSFVFRPPEGVTVLGYWFEPAKKVLNTHSSETAQKDLILDVRDTDALQQQSLWKVQYSLGGISWQSEHIIELSADRRHALFSTLLTIRNHSGIALKDAEIQFIEGELPRLQDGSAPEVRPQSVQYRYSERMDLPAGQERRLLWGQARHIALATRRGLFVGGEFLQKMEESATPLLESALSFPNVKGVGLGLPIPEGRVAVYHQQDGFVSRIGFAKLASVPVGSDVTIRLPASARPQENDALEAQLVQESYRELNATLAEAEYHLVLRNLQSDPISLSITIDTRKGIQYAVARSNVRADRNRNGEAVWNIEIPAQGNREIRYKLTLKAG